MQIEELSLSGGPSEQDINNLSSQLSKLSNKDLYISQAGLQQKNDEVDGVFIDTLYMIALIVFGKQVLRSNDSKASDLENKVKWSKSLLQQNWFQFKKTLNEKLQEPEKADKDSMSKLQCILADHPNLVHEKQKCKVTDVFATFAITFFALYLEANGIESIPEEPEYQELDMIMEFDAPEGPGGLEM